MSPSSLPSVERFTALFDALLRTGRQFKPTGSIEPLLKYKDLKEGIDQVGSLARELGTISNAAIEASIRNIFYNLISTTSILETSFGDVWNLLDIANIVSDFEFTEPGLAMYLVEELLEAQTLDGCRTVMDYLDSRQEFLTEKFFKSRKDLIILRSCNSLLRRSSRAEDNAFCGRVFIFLFQSVPFGDRSAINLRGQFHIENVTTYEHVTEKDENALDEMIVEPTISTNGNEGEPSATSQSQSDKKDSGESAPVSQGSSKLVKFDDSTKQELDQIPDMDTLYAIFWSLQEFFSQPLTLLIGDNIKVFRMKLETVMAKFKQIQQAQSGSGANKNVAEINKGTKRKREDNESEFTSIFNPKYLTSRDLFDLEVIDLSFRRHFLVQALILLDFLLSLTTRAQAKLYPPTPDAAKKYNTATQYKFSLSEEDSKWVTQIKGDIAGYLQNGPEGKFYFRMVDTVLSRDKNWAYWKARGCPDIILDPVTPDQLIEAEKGAQKACAPRRIRPSVMGALDLSFLNAKQDTGGLEKYKDPERYQLPAIDSFKAPIAEDEFDIGTAKDDEEKRAAQERRASKLWRTLRIASRGRLKAFDDIDDGNDLKPIFEPDAENSKDKPDVNGVDGQTSATTQVGISDTSPPALPTQVAVG